MEEPTQGSALPDPERVLLVDLSERERHELREMLQAAGFDVAVARSRADVCLRLLTWQPDGVIADHDLACLDVAELLDVIRATAPVPPTVVLLCSAQPHEETPARTLIKPVPFLDLLSTLQAALADRQDKQQASRSSSSTG